MQVPSLGREDALEEGVVTHSSILAWRSAWQRSLAGCSPRGRTESDATEGTAQHGMANYEAQSGPH